MYQQFKRKNIDGQSYYVNADGDPIQHSITFQIKDMTVQMLGKKE